MTLRVVRAWLNDHEVVAVNCSPHAVRPWTAVDVVKGWTLPCREEDLTGMVPLVPVEGGYRERVSHVGEGVVTGGKSPDGQLQAFGDLIGVPDLPRIVAEGVARIERGITAAFSEDQWRVTSCDESPFTGEAPEAWAYVADRIDRYGFVDRIEHRVDDTWRIRSIRDLIEAAGGDPL